MLDRVDSLRGVAPHEELATFAGSDPVSRIILVLELYVNTRRLTPQT
ncbi:hypothetical protein [Bradyrhizobium monzae]|nr:hypothetical protein [Bradyrhizobium sp. Oc8]